MFVVWNRGLYSVIALFGFMGSSAEVWSVWSVHSADFPALPLDLAPCMVRLAHLSPSPSTGKFPWKQGERERKERETNREKPQSMGFVVRFCLEPYVTLIGKSSILNQKRGNMSNYISVLCFYNLLSLQLITACQRTWLVETMDMKQIILVQ